MPYHLTRQRLIQTIREAGEGTLADLRKRSRLSGSTIRRHLRLMQQDGLVESRYAPGRPGRQPLLYRLTRKGDQLDPVPYPGLICGLFARLQAPGLDDAQALVRQQTLGLATRYPHIRKNPDVQTRLEAARRCLFGTAETSEVVRTDDGYQFSLFNCPILARSIGFYEMCHVARAALSELIGQPVAQTEWLNRGDPRCTFEVRTTKAALTRSNNAR